MPIDWLGFVGPQYDDWYDTETDAELRGITVARLRADLAALGPTENLEVNLSSEGGLADVGLSIMNIVHAESKARRILNPAFQSVVTVVGTAYSAASIICQGFDRCIMATGSEMMIHCASMVAYGNANDFEKHTTFLRGVDERLLDVYVEKTGKKRSDLYTLLADETYLSADAAVELGLASERATLTCRVAPLQRDATFNYSAHMRRQVRLTASGSLAFYSPPRKQPSAFSSATPLSASPSSPTVPSVPVPVISSVPNVSPLPSASTLIAQMVISSMT